MRDDDDDPDVTDADATDSEATDADATDSESPDADSVPADLRERMVSDPYCETLGISLREVEPGRAVTALDVTADLCNFHGTPHGGAVYSLADAAFAAASNSHGDTAVALETNISYLDAVEEGTTLTATAEETHLTRKTAEYEVVVESEGSGDDVTGADDAGDRIATFRGRVYRF